VRYQAALRPDKDHGMMGYLFCIYYIQFPSKSPAPSQPSLKNQ
jgi:hypothetical protein